MFCTYCGKPLPNNSMFCPLCGRAVPDRKGPAPESSPTPGAEIPASEAATEYQVTFTRWDTSGPTLTLTFSQGSSLALASGESRTVILPGGTQHISLDAPSQHSEFKIPLATDLKIDLRWDITQDLFSARYSTHEEIPFVTATRQQERQPEQESPSDKPFSDLANITSQEPPQAKPLETPSSSENQETNKKKHGVFFWLTQIVVGGLLLFGLVVWLTTPHKIISLWKNGLSEQVHESVSEYLGYNTGFSAFRTSNSFGKENVLSSEKIKLSEIQKNLLEWAGDASLKDTMTEYEIETAWYVFDETGASVGTLTVQNMIWTQGDYYWVWDTVCIPDEKLTDALASAQAKQIQDTIHYNGAEIVVYDYDNVELHTHFTFTNFTDEVIAPFYHMRVQAFQNGRSLSTCWSDSDWVSDIQPGYSTEGYEAFELLDWSSPIELIVYDHITMSENSYTISIDPSMLHVSDLSY